MQRSEGVVLVESSAGVATVTLNRPERRNALSDELRRALREVIGQLDRDDEVAAIVLTGADPAFCAGLDLTELAARGADLRDAAPSEEGPTRGPLGARTTPVVGAVNGVAVTGGLELALACDFLVASERARFADTHARVGILPGWGLTVLLPEAVGLRRAREMSATGNYVDAQTALAWGLVNHVVAHDELLDAAHRLAAAIATNDARAVQALLSTYDEVARAPRDLQWSVEAAAHRAWTREHLAGPQSADRLRAVIDRGRSQVAAGDGS